jgi:hypothetical protein
MNAILKKELNQLRETANTEPLPTFFSVTTPITQGMNTSNQNAS